MRQQAPGKLISPIIQYGDYAAYIVIVAGKRSLIIQEEDMSHTYIRLRQDISNDDALHHARALLLLAIARLNGDDDDD
jgi:hypothetical protein